MENQNIYRLSSGARDVQIWRIARRVKFVGVFKNPQRGVARATGFGGNAAAARQAMASPKIFQMNIANGVRANDSA